MSAEKKGYALKTDRGDRPFLYSGEYVTWRNSIGKPGQDAAARTWARRFGMAPKSRAHPDGDFRHAEAA